MKGDAPAHQKARALRQICHSVPFTALFIPFNGEQLAAQYGAV